MTFLIAFEIAVIHVCFICKNRRFYLDLNIYFCILQRDTDLACKFCNNQKFMKSNTYDEKSCDTFCVLIPMAKP